MPMKPSAGFDEDVECAEDDPGYYVVVEPRRCARAFLVSRKYEEMESERSETYITDLILSNASLILSSTAVSKHHAQPFLPTHNNSV
jgi:hypothetical protein